MDARHAIVKPRTAHCERCHVEVFAHGRVPQRQQAIDADADLLAKVLEVSLDDFPGKVVVPCRHCSVCGEHRVPGDSFKRACKIQALLAQQPDALEHEEGRVAFVHVPYRRLVTHRSKRTHAADAQHDFLLEAHGAIAAIQPIRDAAIALLVFCNVGIEQIEPDVAGAHLPYAHRERPPG